MSKVVVCYKTVLDEQDIIVEKQSLLLDTSRAKNKISDYDRNAIEEGIRLAAEKGDELVGLTFGSSKVKPGIKDALSRGIEKVFWINSEMAAETDCNGVAKVLAAAMPKIEEYTLILCGEGAADTYAQQAGPRLGALLGIPVVTYANKIELQEDKAIVTRKLGNQIEVVRVALPAVITVLPDINQPRIPSLKEVMKASKKPVIEYNLEDLGLDERVLKRKTQVESLLGYKMERRNVILKDGGTAEKIRQVVAELTKAGLV